MAIEMISRVQREETCRKNDAPQIQSRLQNRKRKVISGNRKKNIAGQQEPRCISQRHYTAERENANEITYS